jgi:hypothetical protein
MLSAIERGRQSCPRFAFFGANLSEHWFVYIA